MFKDLTLPQWMSLPPLPDWDGLHPFVVHFPIALLLTAPCLVLLAAIAEHRGKGVAVGGLLLMTLGTAGAFVAASTGRAAAELADVLGPAGPVLEEHEELAELTCFVFAALSGFYAILTIAAMFQCAKSKRAPMAVLNVLFLAAYAGATLIVLNTGHLGGRLVHEFGVSIMMPEEKRAVEPSDRPDPMTSEPDAALAPAISDAASSEISSVGVASEEGT
ncbi:MAG TPA: hypothetical protein PLO62_02910 [Candidatus Hydrogenedentes bacterium]|nr:hypothetical protein [Candidatus Hydrogenedentota bacterium]HOS01705.1 hypothetical protein [Candidatus Hydrogenedentota bacterium]